MEKKKKTLTIAQLKNFKGLDNLTDEEADEAITALESLSILFFELYKKDKATACKIRQLKQESDNHEERNAA